MKKKTILILLASHFFATGVGFAMGIYVLPILVAPPAPDLAAVEKASANSDFVGIFSRDRKDSDLLHWGEGHFSITTDTISFAGTLAPGPDYRLYFSPEFIETEADFHRLKLSLVQVGEIRTFENFVVPIREGVDPADFTALIVWCESFGQFITSGAYMKRQK